MADAAFGAACRSCATSLPADARFCPSCGLPVHAPVDERRVVTVLFADLVGFTTLSESRDPEQVKNLVDGCFEWLAAAITAHGGRVDKVVGDAIVGLFGAPVAHEDDAERAVRAALQMQRTLATRAAELPVPVQLRVGINTGEVLVGAIRADGDYTAMGDVVNVASRLQDVAQPGLVVVGPATHAATAGVISYDDLGTVLVRNRDEPVQAWVARAALAPPGHRVHRPVTPLYGRDQELAMLGNALGSAVRRGRAQLALVLGEAGVGKSRLVEELAGRAQHEHHALVFEGRCIPYGDGNVWWPVAEAMRQAAGIDQSDDAETAQDKCAAMVSAITGPAGGDRHTTGGAPDGDDDIVGGLLYLMGHEDVLVDREPSAAQDEAVAALLTLLDRAAHRQPLVVVISELHWADGQLLRLVDTLLDRLRALPVIVVATARPELEERWTPRPGRHNLLVLNLDPLDAEAATELLTTLLGHTPPAPVRELLLERSGGNPFYLEELANLLNEASVVVPALAGRAGVDLASGWEVPATLRALVAARLDTLPAGARAVLEDLAVVGRRGPVDALVDLAAVRGQTDVTDALAVLASRELVDVADGSCEVRSELVREVAYETLTKAERARRHAALAEWLEDRARATDRDGEYLEQIAHHLGIAAEIVLEMGPVAGVPVDIGERTHVAIARAAKRASDREQHLVSAQLYDQALRLLPNPHGRTRRQVLVGRARARAELRQHAGARADAEEIIRIAATDGDDHSRACGLTVLGQVAKQEGRLDDAMAILDEALELWRRVGDEHGISSTLRHRGMTALDAGRPDDAEPLVREALEIAKRVGNRRDEAWALQNLAWIATAGGRFADAETWLSDAGQTFEQLGDSGGLSWALGMQAYNLYFQGRRDEARPLLDRVEPMSRKAGDPWAIGMILMLRTSLDTWDGRCESALDPGREAWDILRAGDDAEAMSRAASVLARALNAAGRFGEADTILETARTESTGRGEVARALLASKVLVTLDRGDVGAAVALYDTWDGPLDGPYGGYELASHLALVRLMEGEPESAAEMLQRSLGEGGVAGGRPAELALLALAYAASDRTTDALRCADAAVEAVGPTYRDLFLAHVARAGALARQGDGAGAVAATDAAVATVDATQDRLFRALAKLARGEVVAALDGGGAHDAQSAADAALRALGIGATGWRTVFASSVGVRPTAGRAAG